MTKHMQIDGENVNEIIDNRGLAVMQYLSTTAGIPAGRLLIVDSRIQPSWDTARCAVTCNLE